MSKTATLYGIQNCDTMKKAFKWLDAQNIAYDFHDYKKIGIDEDVLKQALTQHGWENVINRRGTTWRKLPKDVQESMGADKAIACLLYTSPSPRDGLLSRMPSSA